MKTLKSNLKLSGAGLMFAKNADLEIKPSRKRGIRFYVNGCEIEAKIENVVSCEHCVIIADIESGGKNKVALIEHFMAACAICGIDALDVYISSDGFELPIFDGSAKVWVENFEKTGYEGEAENEKSLDNTVVFQKDNSAIIIAPKKEGKTTITYAVNFNHPDLNNRWVNLEVEKNINEIIEARTFGYLKDLEKFQAAGYSKGVTIDNTVGLTDNGYTVELRSSYEPAKHKILDIIGDFYLTGYNPLKIKANIIVKEAGHFYHAQCAKILKQTLEKK